ncbi:MAG: hypothetical protein HUK19_09415 [Fibrobacter sp.]|nr:hypothetical protein [Fibrobacter sp.]
MIEKIYSSFLAILVSASTALAADVSAPKGEVRGTTLNDFMPHQNSAKEFNESWNYQFVLDNGTRAYLGYSTLYVPGSGQKVACELSFWNFKSKSYTVGRQYPPERLVADKAKATLDIKGEYKLEGKPGKGHHVFFSTEKDGKYFLDLTFDSAEPGKVIGDGVWTIGSNKFAQYIHIPYGRVSGKIAINEDTLTVKGYAYMDQTWQTVQATDIASRVINLSTNARNPIFAGRAIITTDGKYAGYALYNAGEGYKVVIPKNVDDNEKPYNGKGFPKGDLNIAWTDETVPALKFSVAKPFQKASFLDKIDSWIARKAIKMATGGEIFFYRGRSDGSHGKKIDWIITGVK